MRLYAVALVTWAAAVIASSESNAGNFSDDQAVSYAELRDLPTRQIVQPYVTRGTRARNSERTSVEGRRPDDAVESIGAPEGGATDSAASIYATPLIGTTGELSFRPQLGDEAGYAVPEDVLLVENAGSFGQRVRQGLSGEKATAGNAVEYASIRESSSSTVPPVKDESKHEAHVPTRRPLALAPKRENDAVSSDSPFNDTGAIESTKSAGPNSDETVDDGDATGSTSGVRTDTASILENDVVPEHLPRPQARSSRARNATHEDATKKPTVEKPERTTSSTTFVEISPSLTGFSGPIVVPDLSGRQPQDDYVDDSDASSEVLRSIEKADASLQTNVRDSKAWAAVPAISNSIATSSIMLSPLQVGITLMNADEAAGVVDDSEEFAATETKDYLQDDPRHSAAASKEENGENGSNESRPAAEGGEPAEDAARKTPGNSVEIQKSIEIYHTAPVHEIHYPPEYIHQASHLGVIETNNIGGAQRSRLPYGQDERSDLRASYGAYRGNNVAEKSVVKSQVASAISPSFHRQKYNALEDSSIGADPVQATALVAEYSSPSTSLEQRPPLRYNEARRPVLLLASPYEDALYEQSNVRHILDGNNNDAPLHSGKSAAGGGSVARQKATSEFAKPYAAGVYREQPPSNHHQLSSEPRHPFRSLPEARRPEVPQLLLKIVPNGASPEGGFLVPISRPYPIEKIVEKTVHVPIEIEKVIERKVPFPVERVIEKQVQVQVPQPYPVLVEKQPRAPHVYPIHIERLIERRLPYTVQRLAVQPLYPPRLPIYPAPSEQDKPSATASRLPRPYRADAEKPVDHGPTTVTLEAIKFGKFGNQPRTREPPFNGVGDGAGPFEPRQPSSQIANASHFYVDPGYGGIPPTYLDYNVEGVGKGYVPAHLSNVKLLIVPKKVAAHHARLAAQAPSSLPLSTFRRQIVYNLVEKDRGAPLKDEYMGPVPPRNSVFGTQVKALPATKAKPSLYSSVTQSPATTAALRRPRQPEYPGSFRQSKMEYGFKPPMVPSVQYDENSASKVEN